MSFHLEPPEGLLHFVQSKEVHKSHKIFVSQKQYPNATSLFKKHGTPQGVPQKNIQWKLSSQNPS
jgi:hypothetical protein